MKTDKDKEEELTGRGLTQVVIDKMAWAGTNPLKQSFLNTILGCIYVFCVGTVVILMSLSFVHIKRESVGAIVKDLIILIGFMQITFKQITAMQRNDTIGVMLKSAWNNFWLSEVMDTKTQIAIQEIYKKTALLSTIYTYGAMSAVISIIIQAWFAKDKRTIPMDIWIPHLEILQLTPYYEIVFGVEVVVIILGVYICVAQLDKLFIIMIALVYVQFRMIKIKILEISSIKTKQENFKLLRMCVIHHNTVLKFVYQFEEVYSRLFLPTVASNIFLATISMWGFITEELLSSKLSSLFVYFTVMSQVLSYCIAGQIIQDVAMSLGRAAYECDWTGVYDYKLRMGLIMIMTQASRKIELTVGGFMILCMESFAALIRASFSFLAFIINTQT